MGQSFATYQTLLSCDVTKEVWMISDIVVNLTVVLTQVLHDWLIMISGKVTLMNFTVVLTQVLDDEPMISGIITRVNFIIVVTQV